MSFDPSSRKRLSPRDAERFPEETLFHRLARAVCEADCLPRKELFEAWEVARRARRRFRGGRVVDLACGHALAARIMLLLDDTTPDVLAIDTSLPPSAERLATVLDREWPRLRGRVRVERCSIADVELRSDDVLISVHACGALTDQVLDRAVAVRARVAVLPCCHSAAKCDTGGVEGWLDPALAIDVTRAARLRAHGFRVRTQTIPEAITPKNRLLLGTPVERLSPSAALPGSPSSRETD